MNDDKNDDDDSFMNDISLIQGDPERKASEIFLKQ